MLAPRMLLFLLFDHSWNHSWSEVIRICLHKRLWAKCCSKFRWCSKFFELSAFALLVVFYFVCLWALCLCVCTSSMFLILLIWIRIFLVLPVLTTMGSTSGSGRFVPFSCIKSLFVSVMAHILKLMPQITTLGKSVSILLTPFCATPLNGNYLVLSWTVTLPVNFGLLCCLSTNNTPVKIFMNFRINSFRLLFFLRSPSLIFNASLNLILSELVALGDTTFNEDTMISKLLSSLPEGFDHFLTSWESTPASEQTISNIKEELKIKKRILNETTATTSAFYSHTWDPHGRGRFPSQFPHGHCRGLPISGSGFSPLSRGVSPSRHGTPFLHDRHLSRHSPQYSADLAHVKQHTRYIECGAYGHWRHECPRFFLLALCLFLLQRLWEIIVHLVFILLTLLRHYPLFPMFTHFWMVYILWTIVSCTLLANYFSIKPKNICCWCRNLKIRGTGLHVLFL